MGLVKPVSPVLQKGHPLAQGLVGAWPFYEGRGDSLNDLSGNQYNASLVAGPTWGGGSFGSSLSFVRASVQTARIGAPFGVSTGKVSVCVWISSSTPLSAYAEIFRVATATPWYLLFNTTNKLSFTSANAQYDNGYAFTYDGAYHFVVATFDGTTVRLYQDGVLKTSFTDGAMSTASATAWFGDGSDVIGTQALTGSLADAKVYNRALSTAEIAQLYFDSFAIYRPRARWWLMPPPSPAPRGWFDAELIGSKAWFG